MNRQKKIAGARLSSLTRARIVLLAAMGMLVTLGMNGISHAADTGKGGRLYASNCALCHGVSGISVMPGAPNFARGDGMLRPDMTLLSAIRTGKNAMPAFQGRLTDRDIMDVIAYLRTLH